MFSRGDKEPVQKCRGFCSRVISLGSNKARNCNRGPELLYLTTIRNAIVASFELLTPVFRISRSSAIIFKYLGLVSYRLAWRMSPTSCQYHGTKFSSMYDQFLWLRSHIVHRQVKVSSWDMCLLKLNLVWTNMRGDFNFGERNGFKK